VNTKSDPISTAKLGFKEAILSPVSARTVSPVDSPRFPIGQPVGNGGRSPPGFKIMQAIHTKYLPSTNNRGSRIKATCERGSVTIPYPHELSGDEVHREAVRRLLERFVSEDWQERSEAPSRNPWKRDFVTGCLPDGTFAHVFIL
jgi:hypothetical protein